MSKKTKPTNVTRPPTKGAKNFTSVVKFQWRVSNAGYDLSPDRKVIVRRPGNSWRSYDPAAVNPPLYLTFRDLCVPSKGKPRLADRDAPIHRRLFPDTADAMLAFVREYGFLSRADADSETVAFLEDEGAKLWLFDAVVDPANADKDFNTFPTGTPYLRPVLTRVGGGRIAIQFEPVSLYSWLWLSLARGLASGAGFGRCLHCEDEMQLGSEAGGRRAHTKFCSAKCRVGFSRRPKAEQVKRLREYDRLHPSKPKIKKGKRK